MGIVQIVGCLLVLLVNVVQSDVICMQCDEAATIDECIAAGTIKCGTQEQCFLEKVTTKNLNFVYNAGCRSAVVCNIMSTLGGGNGRRDLSRQSRQLVNCAQCCNTDPGVVAKGPCNSELCGAKPTVDNSIRCLDCDHLVSGSAFCTSREVCTDTQVCATSIHILGGTQIKYNFRCEEKHLCEGMIKNGIHNRASEATGVKICDACCKDEECNKKDCFELRKLMPTQFGNGTAAVTTPKPATPAPTTKPTTPVPTTKPTTPVPTTKPTTPVPTTKPTTPVPTTKPTTPVPTTKPTTPVPTTKPTTPVPTTKPTTPVPTTKPTTPVPTTKSTTPVPTTKSTTPVPTTKPTTPVPTTKPTTTVPTTKSTTPVPTTATTKPTTPVPTTPVPTPPTTPVPTTPTTPVPSTPVPSNNPSTPIASSAPPSGSSRRPSTFAPNFTVI